MEKLTVIINDEDDAGYPAAGVLIYVIDVPEGTAKNLAKSTYNPDEGLTAIIKDAVVLARADDLDGVLIDPETITLLFAYAGDLQACADWRE